MNIAIALARFYKTLEFFENNPDRINHDALLGIRISQGIFIQLKSINLSNKLDQAMSNKLKLSIHILNKRFVSLTDKVNSRLVKIKTMARYYSVFQSIIPHPYINRHTRVNQINSYTPTMNYLDVLDKGMLSDRCLDLILNQNCKVSWVACGKNTWGNFERDH